MSEKQRKYSAKELGLDIMAISSDMADVLKDHEERLQALERYNLTVLIGRVKKRLKGTWRKGAGEKGQ